MSEKPEGKEWLGYIDSIFDPIELLQVIQALPEHLTDPKHAESGAAIKAKMEALINDAETKRGGGDPWRYDANTRALAQSRKINS